MFVVHDWEAIPCGCVSVDKAVLHLPRVSSEVISGNPTTMWVITSISLQK